MSWIRSAFSGVTSAAGNVRKAAENVAGQFQDRLAGKHYTSFKDASVRLERVALDMRGEQRLMSLQRWLSALRDVTPAGVGTGGGPPVGEASLRSSLDGEGGDGAVPASSAKQVLFYDPDISSEPLTFRDVFLCSCALENIATTIVEEMPMEEEEGVLLELFGLTLTGTPQQHTQLLEYLKAISLAVASSREEEEESNANHEEVIEAVRCAMSALKHRSEDERLDAVMSTTKEIMARRLSRNVSRDQAGGSNSLEDDDEELGGDGSEPVLLGNNAPLVETVTRTAEALELAQQLCYTAYTRVDPQRREARAQKLQQMGAAMEERRRMVMATIGECKEQLAHSHRQKDEAARFRETKLAETREAVAALIEEHARLLERKAELEGQLSEVNFAIARNLGRRKIKEEEVEEFNDANSDLVTDLGLKEQEVLLNLETQGRELNFLTGLTDLLGASQSQLSEALEANRGADRALLQRAARDFLLAATAHVQSRTAELAFLLTRLRWCRTEAADILNKWERMEGMGMERMLEDLRASRRSIQAKYDDAERQAAAVAMFVEEHIRRPWETLQAQLAVNGCKLDDSAASASSSPAALLAALAGFDDALRVVDKERAEAPLEPQELPPHAPASVPAPPSSSAGMGSAPDVDPPSYESVVAEAEKRAAAKRVGGETVGDVQGPSKEASGMLETSVTSGDGSAQTSAMEVSARSATKGGQSDGAENASVTEPAAAAAAAMSQEGGKPVITTAPVEADLPLTPGVVAAASLISEDIEAAAAMATTKAAASPTQAVPSPAMASSRADTAAEGNAAAAEKVAAAAETADDDEELDVSLASPEGGDGGEDESDLDLGWGELEDTLKTMGIEASPGNVEDGEEIEDKEGVTDDGGEGGTEAGQGSGAAPGQGEKSDPAAAVAAAIDEAAVADDVAMGEASSPVIVGEVATSQATGDDKVASALNGAKGPEAVATAADASASVVEGGGQLLQRVSRRPQSVGSQRQQVMGMLRMRQRMCLCPRREMGVACLRRPRARSRTRRKGRRVGQGSKDVLTRTRAVSFFGTGPYSWQQVATAHRCNYLYENARVQYKECGREMWCQVQVPNRTLGKCGRECMSTFCA
eukprot:jgi/Mesvir1/11743/Mv00117-RA.1